MSEASQNNAEQVETTGGKTAKAVSSLAVPNQMWIVYGAPKK
ncbi:hypothetical protein [Eubacterium sp. 14-2]|nr:hypothetical protein [Eubacterium sp. 14-2]